MHAALAPHNGNWLHASPISSRGLRLDDEALRIAVVLRLGSNLRDLYECRCGLLVCKGSFSLSCRRSSDRSALYSFLNELIFYDRCRAGIFFFINELASLKSSDEKRPDGLTSTSRQAEKHGI